jgi:transcription termination factor NusB
MEEALADSGVEESGIDMDSAINEISSDVFGVEEPTEVEEVAEEVTEEVTDEVQEEPVEEVKEAPQSWKKEMREHFASLTPEVQDYIVQRENQMREGLEKDRGDANLGRVMRDVMSPYSEMLKTQGIDESVMVRNLMNAHYQLSTADTDQKISLIKQIAQSYGVPLDGEQQQIDPALKAVMDKVNGLEQHLTASHQRSLQEARTRVESEVAEFAAAHEFFDDVSEQIVPLINSGYSLEEAYQNAIWLNPVTRQKEIDRAAQEAAVKAEEKAKQEVEKAKKAKSANVRGRDTTRSPTEPTGTMEDTMRETLREIQNRSH